MPLVSSTFLTILLAGIGSGPFADGDRVVLLGGTWIERDQSHGDFETRLTAAFPDRTIHVRNLGWSGDTVGGVSRSGFDPPAEGFKRLTEHIRAVRPTVILLGYGANESFAGRAGLDAFRSGYEALLGMLDREAPKARLILLAPLPQEDLGRPFPDPAAHNRDLALYRDAIRDLARSRDARFVDVLALAQPLVRPASSVPLTEDTLIPGADGSWRLARVLADALDVPAPKWSVELRSDGTPGRVVGTRLEGDRARVVGEGLAFDLTDERLPAASRPVEAPRSEPRFLPGEERRLVVSGLKSGSYSLKTGGKVVARASAQQWGSGVTIERGPEIAQADALRTEINQKNRLYFHRWRPQNETYLFGFRKHEQGQNAREVPMFDPLVQAREERIAALRTPKRHTYELVRDEEAGR